MLDHLIKPLDSFLNKITMYRLALYYLIAIVISAGLLSFLKLVPYTFLDILIGSVTAVIVGFIANYLFAKIFNAVTNVESVFITSLIIVLISPIKFPQHILFLAITVVIAMASKYILAINKRHIFNPAAIAVVISSFFGYGASWWVGTAALLPIVILGGLLLSRKIQREKIITIFVLIYLIIVFAFTVFQSGFSSSLDAIRVSIFDSSLLFFVFVMFVEPQTSPTTKKIREYYAYLVGGIYAISQLGFLGTFVTPEVALTIGNIFNFIVSPNYRMSLNLKTKLKLSNDTYSFIFPKQSNFNFTPGQYMEWTLPHENADSRGVRRYFSLSSSPTENEIALTSKFYTPSSTYKNKLLNITPNQRIIASGVSGDFTLPKNPKTPIAFIAGGVGITPFRSMIKYLTDKNLSSDVILLYSNRQQGDILFKDVFDEAAKLGIKTEYFLTDKENLPKSWNGEVGYIDENGIKKLVPDYKKRTFYISGPQLLVDNLKQLMIKMGITRSNIKTDFFPGYSEQK